MNLIGLDLHLHLAVLWFGAREKDTTRLGLRRSSPVADEKTLEALIANRYEVMAGYARQMRNVFTEEVANAKLDASILKIAKRWIHRDGDKVPAEAQASLKATLAAYPVLEKMLAMR